MRMAIVPVVLVVAVSLSSVGFAGSSVIKDGNGNISTALPEQKGELASIPSPANDNDPLLQEMLNECTIREDNAGLPLLDEKEPMAVAGKTVK